MIVDLKDYVIAAILSDIHSASYSGFARVFDVEQFQEEFERVYQVSIPAPLISASVHKLLESGGGRVVCDPFTRDYIYLDAESCGDLFRQAEDAPDTVLGKAYLIGRRYIEEALLRITELGEKNLLAEYYDFENPNEFVELDHVNDARVKAIDEAFDELRTQLDNSNESAVQLGDARDIAKSEVEALQSRWQATKIRASAFINQAQQTLIWISREAAKTVVGQSAKRLFDLIMSYLF